MCVPVRVLTQEELSSAERPQDSPYRCSLWVPQSLGVSLDVSVGISSSFLLFSGNTRPQLC